ncbi:MAG: hypothetical protein FWG91_01310 [Lachnospiraceae bacterium]|nr:hypothetical protein [Lachnospiraceae bacterium]
MSLSHLLKRALHKSSFFQYSLGLALSTAESLFKKVKNGVEYKRILFRNQLEQIVNLQLVVSYPNNNFNFNARSINLIDFKNCIVHQYNFDCPPIKDSVTHYYKQEGRSLDIGSFFMGIKKEHSVHMRKDQNYICLNCGYYIQIVNTQNLLCSIVPANYLSEIWMYCDTGAYSPDDRYWYSVRWKLTHTFEMINGEQQYIPCEIIKVELETLKIAVVNTIHYKDNVHQITCSPDERYLVITSFKQNLYIDYPKESIYTNPKGYRKSHEKGIIPDEIVTLDLKTGHYWYTQIPTPVPAHVEFDLINNRRIYLSTHNMKTYQSNIFLEGNAAIYRLDIKDGETIISGCYTGSDVYRITQPDLFLRNGKVMISTANTPDKLDIIDAETMSLYERIIVTPNIKPLNFSKYGSALAPNKPNVYLSSTPSSDGRYVIVGAREGFKLYDMDAKELTTITERLPENMVLGYGHPRQLGK